MNTTASSYRELQDKIAELQRQAEQARAEELQGAIQQIRTLMNDYGITVDDLQNRKAAKGAQKKSDLPVAFRDSEGNTWSGRGRMPGWLQGKDKEQFRVA